ncbi:hypothetical protein CERSUDRAFT_53081 [Gelatoporia subvermispora B]|uniref:Alpha/beta hydrolase fold-3 domain-containing protein n=1 Tax=Ceriporiopsis subvermispora (strain B) TaxID=914234 RepID=M2QVB7_CERS8|nr:hypothetical protein CERSUDRAFT_53081 [Gelatoporia subvermispora B]
MQNDQLSVHDPDWDAVLALLPPPTPPPASLADARDIWRNVILPLVRSNNEPLLPKESEYRVEDHQIPVEGGQITLRSLIPTPSSTADRKYPLLYFMHGGGRYLWWVYGTIDLDDFFLRAICVEFQIVVVNVEYRLAPEFPFPTPIDDAYAGLKWAAEHASLFSASLAKGFIVSGTSAGANLATVLAHRARDDPFFKDSRISGQLLQIPSTVHPGAYPEEYKAELNSYATLGDPRILDKRAMDDCYGGYPESPSKYGAPPSDPECSPLLYPSHVGVAPAYIQVCGADALRDEALLYERLLREDGVQTKMDVYVAPLGFHHLHRAYCISSDTQG